ncbi:MAG: ion channel [Armatimonadota bacterium]
MLKNLRKYLRELLHTRKFMLLFISMLLWLAIEPFLSKHQFLYDILIYIYILVTIVTVYVITKKKWIFVAYSLVSVAAILLPPVSNFAHFKLANALGLTMEFVLNISLTLFIILYTSAKEKYDKDDIFAVLLGFLLIGACFADIYYSMYALNPGTLHFDISVAHPSATAFGVGDFIYFSYITLTTVGYGDIYPVSNIAKRLCMLEASVGVLYVAVFIGRLIAIYEQTKIRSRKQD